MASLSITKAWNETVEFVGREARLILPISFLLLALPQAVLEAAQPRPAGPGRLEGLGPYFLLLLLALLVAMVGNVAIACLALRPGTSVAEALRRGATRFPAVFAAACITALALVFLLLTVSGLVFMLSPAALSALKSGAMATPAFGAALLLVAAIMLPFALYFAARLLVTTPVAAAEDGGPLQILARSWRLTAPFAWKLVGFFVLMSILIGVLGMAIESVAGIFFTLVAGPVEQGNTSAWLVIIVMAAVNTIVLAYLISLIARIYAQLAGDAEVSRVFT